MEEMYTITLSDGSTIEHLRLNGNNFISRIEVTEEDFEGKLAHQDRVGIMRKFR